MWDYLLPFSSPQPPFYSTYSAMSMAHAHVLREDWKSLRTSEVWNNCLACHRGCAWFKYFVWWRWSIARLYDFVGITFFGHVILRKHNCLVGMLEVLLFLCQYELLSWIFQIWIFMPQLRRITLKLCQLAFHIKNCLFYHLPTRGRAGIKLGDAWYVSNVSIIFDCSMLYYLLFWAILGFIFHFYIIFGTNLLTGSPAQICRFMPISVFWRKGISDGVETEWNQLEKFFLEGNTPDGLGPHIRRYGSCPRGWGRAPCLVGPSWLPWRTSYTYITPRDLKLPERTIDREFHRQKPP